MYSLGAYELQERKRKAEQDRLKKTTSKNWKPSKRNRFLTNIYGKGLDGLSTASVVRRDAHIQNALQFPEETSMFGEPTVPVKGGAYASWNAMAPCKQLAPPSMQFRDEYPAKELGGRFGVSRYIARSYFRGGGQKDHEKTAELKARKASLGGALAVDALDPREATVSLGGVGLRLAKGPYFNPGHFLRVRQRHKELGPPFVYNTRTEPERVTAQLTVETLNDPGPFTDKTMQEIQYPKWRFPDKKKFQEPWDFRKYHRTALMDTEQMCGLPNIAPLSVSEAYQSAADLQGSFRQAPRGVKAWNTNQPHGTTFSNYSPPRRKEPSALHCSLRGVTLTGHSGGGAFETVVSEDLASF